MAANLRPEAQELVAEVEKRTGLPVQIDSIQGLAVAATITPAYATESYVLQYRPSIGFKDYAVAFQCGLLLRVLAVPEADRRQFALQESGIAWDTRLVRAHLKATKKAALPDQVVDSFVSQPLRSKFAHSR